MPDQARKSDSKRGLGAAFDKVSGKHASDCCNAGCGVQRESTERKFGGNRNAFRSGTVQTIRLNA